ncbi:MAG: type II toxin-antitoxin system death-on-curing family toxin [Thaumarchaeota archaeon]|nr:type II toxin-antitoxin system death-on-curing family toxin [Nitrososphaerota archaeon]
MIELPTEDDIIQLNKEILKTIKVKKADKHKVVKEAAIAQAIESARKSPGDLYDKATIPLINLVQGHPFDSGNRRTAFAAAMTFLRLNGECPKVVHDAKVLQGIREGFYTKDEVKKWLKWYGIRTFNR